MCFQCQGQAGDREGACETDRPREKHGDETYWRESEKNVNERREKQRDTDKTAEG